MIGEMSRCASLQLEASERPAKRSGRDVAQVVTRPYVLADAHRCHVRFGRRAQVSQLEWPAFELAGVLPPASEYLSPDRT